MRKLFPASCLLACAAALPAAGNLEIYFIDVEGGQATLFVSPSRESMLVDAGWAGSTAAMPGASSPRPNGGREEDRLPVITHYHADHVAACAACRKDAHSHFVITPPNRNTRDASAL